MTRKLGHCALSCDMGEISVHDKILIKNLKKKKNGNRRKVLHEFSLYRRGYNRQMTNGLKGQHCSLA